MIHRFWNGRTGKKWPINETEKKSDGAGFGEAQEFDAACD